MGGARRCVVPLMCSFVWRSYDVLLSLFVWALIPCRFCGSCVDVPCSASPSRRVSRHARWVCRCVRRVMRRHDAFTAAVPAKFNRKEKVND